MLHYHGTPITPGSVLQTLAGRNFCVSYAAPQNLKVCHQIGQSVMLDNGAYSHWKQGKATGDWSGWAAWVEPWLDYPTTWCVLPDSVDGGVEENDRLLVEYASLPGAPVWHLHEPLERLQRLTEDYEKVCFGSSGVWSRVGSVGWHRRVRQAFDAIADVEGRVPWVHMLRGMSMSGGVYPFASVDSTDVARNHHLPQHSALSLASRWDSMQTPARWTRVHQLEAFA